MNIRHIIITFLCFLLTGCLSYPVVSDIELKARNHMELAIAKENESNFQEAIKEYTLISEMYPDTNYYKTAVLRAAVLNLYPNNPKIDYTAAQDWLQIYLKLPLASKEKEIAVLYAALIQKIEQNIDEKNKILTLIEQQKKDKESLAQELKHSQKNASTYEAELSILTDELKKMKEIDVQMHKTRKTNSGKSLGSD